ncbi:MAG: SAF domain-containing protein, partial [Acidimicrobiales bacterium]
MTSVATRSAKNGRTAPVASPVGIAGTGNPRRKRQLPWVVLGVLLVSSSILGFALWSIAQGERTAVLVASSNIDAGAVIQRGDLVAIGVGADAGVRLLEQNQIDLIVGRRARGPIPAGTPLSLQLVTNTDALPKGSAVVGAALSAGEYPTSALRAGDSVQLIQVAGGANAAEDGLRILGVAKVWTIESLSGSAEPRLFISLLVDESQTVEVANAVSLGQLRLV